MGVLDGGIAALFGDVFGEFYLDGTLYRTEATRQTRDDRGRIEYAGSPVTDRIKGQIESVTESMRSAEGYTDQDVRLIILQVGPDGVIARPSTGNEVSIGGQRWSVDLVGSDPANSYWDMRGTPRP